MPKALSQNLETIAALQSFCVFGYQTEDLLPAVAEAGYFVGCASRLMANDLILVCADAARNPAWGLFLVSRVGPEGVILENVAGLTPDTINGLTFLRSPLGPLPVGKLLREARAARAARSRGAAA
ncbi:MAG TPA: hypothetical protein VIS03_19745 [Kiloniellaceae bacterium]